MHLTTQLDRLKKLAELQILKIEIESNKVVKDPVEGEIQLPKPHQESEQIESFFSANRSAFFSCCGASSVEKMHANIQHRDPNISQVVEKERLTLDAQLKRSGLR